MWKRTNKKIATILVIFLGIFIVSCKNPLNFKQEAKESQKAYISISANLPGSNARTVLPTAVTESTTDLTWKLTGKITDSGSDKTFEKSWNDTEDKTAYQQMIYPDADSGILLDVGNWQFMLTVSNTEGKVLEATLGNENNPIQITKDGENKLEFVMQEASGEGAANGQIEFTLKFPQDVVSQVKATLYTYPTSPNGENTNLDIQTRTDADGKSYSCVVYENSNYLAPGYYKLNLALQQKTGTEKYETITTYSCLIYVAPGLLSSGSYTLESLAKLYPVKFELNGGTLEGETTLTYNKYQTFTLPTPNPPNDDVEFGGWYKEEDYSTKIESNYRLPDNVSDDGVTLYAKWERKLSLDNIFAIGDQDSTPNEVSEDNAIYSPYDNKYGILTITNPNNSSSVWDYYVRTNRSVSFSQGKNYSVSVDLKSEGGDTVVGIQAAYADMFFTVGTDWTTCTFETGYLDKALPDGKNGITIGSALASKVYISNLVITEIDDDNLPTLAFNVTKTGITSYLNNANRPKNIIELTKTSSNDGYNITINTLLSHSEDNTDGQSYLVEDVTLEIRDYVSSNGLNKACFNMSVSDSDLQTALEAKTDSSNMYSTRWNSSTTVNSNESEAYTVFFPSYKTESTEEFFLDGLLKGGNDSSTTINLSNFEISNASTQDVLEAGKVFIIKGGNTFYRCDSITKEFVIKKENPLYCDVLLAVPKDSSGNSILQENGDFFEDPNYNQFGWIDCIRFIPNNVSSTDSFSINIENGEDGKPSYFVLTNKKDEEIILKISLDDEYKVQIEEVITTGGTTSGWEDVGGITYASLPNPEVNGSIDTFYISDLSGLKTYRDLINGTKGFSLLITSDDGTSYTRTFDPSTMSRYDAILTSDITIEDAWTPIGTSDYPFKSSFDGQGHSITFAENSSFSVDYAGVFGYVGNKSASTTSISNLVVKGKGQDAGITTSAQYAGGIVAYSYGATISNCVNKLKINNTYEKPDSSVKEFGTGGIVGYTKKDTIISSCVNFAELVSTSSIGGIVGFADVEDNYSPLSISKCINIGSIKGSSNGNYVSGILGRTATDTTISNCINFGERGCNGGHFPLNHSGVATVTDSGNLTISNCINAGPYADIDSSGSIAIAYGNIKESSNLYYNKDNWCYDYSGNHYEVTVEDNCDITGLSTEDFFDSSKCVLVADENWSCVTDKSRYPLPNLSSVFTDNTIWKEICDAAEIESSNNVQNIVTTWSELRTAITNASSEIETIITIGKDIELTSTDSYITVSYNIKLISAGEVTISRNGFTGSLFNLSGGTLSLGDDTENKIIIDGNKESNSASYPFIVVPSGILNIYNGVILRNNNNTATNANNIGGGIVVRGGVVNIYGGTIKSCESKKGGGIYITSGELNLYGGEISSCISNGNGGGICIEGGTVTMQGGSIKNNEAKISSPANTAGGGGVYLKKNTSINISGGEIKENFTNSYGGGIGSNTGLGIVYITANPTIADNYTTEGTDSQNLYATTYINGVDIDNTAINEDIIDGQLQTEQTD